MVIFWSCFLYKKGALFPTSGSSPGTSCKPQLAGTFLQPLCDLLPLPPMPGPAPPQSRGRGALQERNLAGGNRQNFHHQRPTAASAWAKGHQDLKLEDLT